MLNKKQGSFKILVWIGIMDVNITGPFFYESTVNGVNYLVMLNNEVIPVFAQKGMPLYFQQDGASQHFVVAVRQWLK